MRAAAAHRPGHAAHPGHGKQGGKPAASRRGLDPAGERYLLARHQHPERREGGRLVRSRMTDPPLMSGRMLPKLFEWPPHHLREPRTELSPTWLCLAELQYVNGLGEFPGAPGAAAELAEDP